MIDGKPQFTIQLKVNNGFMSVEQIRGLSNSVLSDHLKQQYTEAFRVALQNPRQGAKLCGLTIQHWGILSSLQDPLLI
jgi:hypothetical protein